MQRYLAAAALTFATLFGSHVAGVATAGEHVEPNAPDNARAGARPNLGVVFVADLFSNAVWICPANVRVGFLPATGRLQGVNDPIQIAIDSAGTIYVANAQIDANGDGSITEYPRGSTTPSVTLTSELNTSTGVAVDSAGTVYVSNKFSATIQVFPKGHTVPTATITANLTGPDGLAVDAAGDLFIADGSANDVAELKRGSSVPRPLHLQGLASPIGIALDSKGTLYVSNLANGASGVAVFAPGTVKPQRTFAVAGPPEGSTATVGQPTMLSVAPDDTLIASTYLSVALIDNNWIPNLPVVSAFRRGSSQPEWTVYGFSASDAVFQPAQ